MSRKQRPHDATDRRRFLQLLGATGVATGLGVGGASADRAAGGDDLNAVLKADAYDWCPPYGYHCFKFDYYLPVGSTVTFDTSYSSGHPVLTEYKKRNLETDDEEILQTCEEGDATNPLPDCEEFEYTFDEEGEFEIRFEMWNEDGLMPSPMATASWNPGHYCDVVDELDCDTLSFKTFELEPQLEVVTDDRPEVDDTVIFYASLSNNVKYDAVEWEFETFKIDDEPEPAPDPDDEGQFFARRPTESGTYIAVATAKLGDVQASTTLQLTVDPRDDLSYEDPEITVDDADVTGEVTLSNTTNETLTADLVLKEFGGNGTVTIDADTPEIDAGAVERVPVSGSKTSRADVLSLRLNGDPIASKDV